MCFQVFNCFLSLKHNKYCSANFGNNWIKKRKKKFSNKNYKKFLSSKMAATAILSKKNF